MKVKLNAAVRLAAAEAPKFPHVLDFFYAHDKNVGDGSMERPREDHLKSLKHFVEKHGEDKAKRLDDFIKPLSGKQMEDLSNVLLGEKPRTMQVPRDIKEILWSLFDDE